MRRLLIILLLLLVPLPVSAKRVQESQYDFIISRQVVVKREGRFRLLDSIAEKPGTYLFPCFICWDADASCDYNNSWNPIENNKRKKEATQKAQKEVKEKLNDEIKNSTYVIPIEIYKNGKWKDYKTITVHGKEEVIID